MLCGPNPATLRFLLKHGAGPNLGRSLLSYAELRRDRLMNKYGECNQDPDVCAWKQN